MRLNGVMAAMAAVSVASVIGGEVKFGPLARMVFGPRSEPSSSAALDAMVVYGDAWAAEDASSTLAPPGRVANPLVTGPEPDVGLPQFNAPASAGMGPEQYVVGRGAFAIGGLAAALGPNAMATSGQSDVQDLQPLPVPQSPVTLTTPPSPTPEPNTWAMMILGVGAIGLALRGRRRAAMRAGA